MIEAHGPTKRHGSKTAADDVWFTARPAKVTASPSPKGATR